ncbi:MAG: cysteine desulfurase [Reichenbachiella sp.]
MKVYFDNSATTPLDPKVLEAMLPYYTETFGNPSSIHSHGRQARAIVERSRKKVADMLNTSPSEIFFTSGGTEADNTAICSTIDSLGKKVAITSKLEHHAVLHSLEALEKKGAIKLLFVDIDEKGILDLNHLSELLSDNKDALVSLMHANNEIGNLNDLEAISTLCSDNGAIFHTDTVQSMGKYNHDLDQLKVDFLVGSAHKFHGPKGIGFLYINHETKINPLIHGGAQERNMRGGTENVAGIVGLATALEISLRDHQQNEKHIKNLKSVLIDGLKEKVKGVSFNGLSADLDESLYSVLNVCIPESEENDMLLFNLDIKGISASGGSACSSGSSIGSHVLTALGTDPRRGAIRFSMSKYNNLDEVNYTVDTLADLVNK